MSIAQNLDSLWKPIEKNIEAEKYQSASKDLEAFIPLARKQNHIPYLGKALFHQAQVHLNNTETTFPDFLHSFKKETDAQTGVNHLVFKMLLAKLYNSFQMHNNISTLETEEDTQLWSREQLQENIQKITTEVLAQKGLLITEPSQKWEMLLEQNNKPLLLKVQTTLWEIVVVEAAKLLKKPELLTELILEKQAKGDTDAYVFFKNYSLQDHQLAEINELTKIESRFKYDIYRRLAHLYYSREDNPKKALEYISEFPDDPFMINLTKNIKNQDFQINAEEFVSPNLAIPLQISHKNIKQLQVRVFAFPQSPADHPLQNLLQNKSTFVEKLTSSYKLVDQYSIVLKSFDDYKHHRTIAAGKPLKNGSYLLLFSSDSDFKENIEYLLLQVSNYHLFNDGNIRAVNRETGKPLAKKSIEIYSLKNNKLKKISTVQTDKDGLAKYDLQHHHYLKLPDESIYYKNRNYNYTESSVKEVDYYKVFTDRSIYRPGQLVHFKIIGYRQKDTQVDLLKKTKIKVSLFDSNRQLSSEQHFTTNDWGSTNGTFSLPTGGNTGHYSIAVNGYTQQSIRVEEYKKPKFQVNIHIPQQVIAFGRDVKIEGAAESYAGATLFQAKGEYTVYRQNYHPFWRRGAVDENVPVASGNFTTNDQGKFDFSFQPKGDSLSTYRYKVEVRITDQNGETQSSSEYFNVSAKKIFFSATAPTPSTIRITGVNIQGDSLPFKAHVKIYSLKAPSRPLRNSPLSMDYALYDKSSFVKLFPHEPYLDELLPSKWEQEKQLVEKDINDNTTISLPASFKGGYVRVKIQSPGEPEHIENIYLEGTGLSLLDVKKNNEVYRKGEVATLNFNSSADDMVLYIRIESGEKRIEEKTLALKNGKATLQFPIQYDLDYHVHYSYTKYNTSASASLRLPTAEKKIEILRSTYRNKIRPGDKETWTITLKGQNIEGLSAMYDASLDALYNHQWPSSGFNPYIAIKHRYSAINYLHGMTYTEPLLRIDLPDTYYLNTEPLTFHISRALLEWAAPRNRYKLFGVVNAQAKMDAAPVALAEEALMDPEEAIETPYIRKNLNETAFFYPTLQADKDGNLQISFTAPESLTEWKWMSYLHSPDLNWAYMEERIKTQKELMVTPNFPRFLRNGDHLRLSAKIDNLSAESLRGEAKILVKDPITEKLVFSLKPLPFQLESNKSTDVAWEFEVPEGIEALNISIIAATSTFSDGEETTLPVLSQKILVTEALSLSVREGDSKSLNFDKLPKIKPYKLTFELHANPLWNAIFALPYLLEYPYDCAEQVFSKLFANRISQVLLTSHPRIKTVFDLWNKNALSPLQTNEELKNILLEETPWLRDGKNEVEQQKRIALLFDLNRMSQEQNVALSKLKDLQLSSGGFPWFAGGKANFYISSHILSGLGSLKKYEAELTGTEQIIKSLIKYLDREMETEDHYLKAHYFYARSFFAKEYPLSSKLDSIKTKFYSDLKINELSLQGQVLVALAQARWGEVKTAKGILELLKEQAVNHEESGMYWKKNQGGWFWYQAPIETQALLIEAFDEILDDQHAVEAMKVWLIKSKRAQQWPSTKSTTLAVKALLMHGKSLIGTESGVLAQIGEEKFDGASTTAGYLKKTWNADEIKSEMSTLKLEKSSAGIAWANAYWQYFEDLDKVSAAANGVSIKKGIYLKDKGTNVLKEITQSSPIKVGDQVIIRLILEVGQDMEFVHIKDYRAAGFEPVNVLSSYKYQNGIYYYESTRDVATHFFADYIKKGKYVFEYELNANNAGSYSNGIAQLQNMYAPEFSAHSEGTRVLIRF